MVIMDQSVVVRYHSWVERPRFCLVYMFPFLVFSCCLSLVSLVYDVRIYFLLSSAPRWSLQLVLCKLRRVMENTRFEGKVAKCYPVETPYKRQRGLEAIAKTRFIIIEVSTLLNLLRKFFLSFPRSLRCRQFFSVCVERVSHRLRAVNQFHPNEPRLSCTHTLTLWLCSSRQ